MPTQPDVMSMVKKNCRRKIIRKREQRISERLKVLSAIKNI